MKIYDNTIIIYTSDHGNHFKTRNNEYKRSCHDSSIRIPLIIKGGPFDGSNVVDKLVSLIDIPKTMERSAIFDPITGHYATSISLSEEIAPGEYEIRIVANATDCVPVVFVGEFSIISKSF